jgi:hypothetical protein
MTFTLRLPYYAYHFKNTWKKREAWNENTCGRKKYCMGIGRLHEMKIRALKVYAESEIFSMAITHL